MSDPRSPEPTESRRRILDAAQAEFASYGLAGARVSRIAAEAQANKQLIYHYFGDKQGLYDAVLTELVLQAREAQSSARAGGASYTRDFFGASTIHPETQRTWARLLAWEGLTDAPSNPELERVRRDNVRMLVQWLEADQRTGAITDRFTANELYAFFLSASVFPYVLPNLFKLIFDVADVSTDALASWHASLSTLLQDLR